jgi:hypothetical protein
MLFKRLGDHRPGLLQIEFTILGKQCSEGRFFCESATGIVTGLEFINLLSRSAVEEGIMVRGKDLPFVNIFGVPWFVPLMCGRHCALRKGESTLHFLGLKKLSRRLELTTVEISAVLAGGCT